LVSSKQMILSTVNEVASGIAYVSAVDLLLQRFFSSFKEAVFH
jgi:hypothetical protein